MLGDREEKAGREERGEGERRGKWGREGMELREGGGGEEGEWGRGCCEGFRERDQDEEGAGRVRRGQLGSPRLSPLPSWLSPPPRTKYQPWPFCSCCRPSEMTCC